LCPLISFRGKTTRFNPFFVGGLYAKTGKLFEILKHACPKQIIDCLHLQFGEVAASHPEKRSIILPLFGHFDAVPIQWRGMSSI